jgi:hypothetical protein
MNESPAVRFALFAPTMLREDIVNIALECNELNGASSFSFKAI